LSAIMQSGILEKKARKMNSFGRNSRKHLSTVDARLQRIAHRVLRIKDHSIIQGHRNKADQNAAFDSDASKLRWPNGKHNRLPSIAMDVQTYPRPESQDALREDQIYLLGIYKGVAQEQGLPVRVGMDWDNDGEIADNGFDDSFHVELIE